MKYIRSILLVAALLAHLVVTVVTPASRIARAAALVGVLH